MVLVTNGDHSVNALVCFRDSSAYGRWQTHLQSAGGTCRAAWWWPEYTRSSRQCPCVLTASLAPASSSSESTCHTLQQVYISQHHTLYSTTHTHRHRLWQQTSISPSVLYKVAQKRAIRACQSKRVTWLIQSRFYVPLDTK